jgi:hypothetical protein
MHCRWRSSYQEGKGGVEIPLTELNAPHVCACPKAGNEFPTLYTVVFLCPMSSVEMIYVIVDFVDIADIDDL